ncbi:MAG: hypothetical protein JWQ96_1413, partial [Segetibacter sp.]|nr:hypothetical protein [Segetibacter sp.]
MYRGSAFVITLLITHLIANAQDSVKKKVKFEADVESWGALVAYKYNPPINSPEYLSRFQNYLNSSRSVDTIKDSPLRHGAFYAALKTTTSISEGIKLRADFYGEHRGFSYGIYSQKNVVVYPVIQLEVKDSISIRKHKLFVEGRT